MVKERESKETPHYCNIYYSAVIMVDIIHKGEPLRLCNRTNKQRSNEMPAGSLVYKSA
jgi:hypothetical protein